MYLNRRTVARYTVQYAVRIQPSKNNVDGNVKWDESERQSNMKRKNSNLSSDHAHGMRLSNSASVHAQVHRLPKSPACNIQMKFIVLVSLYMIGSFVICLYHLSSLTIQMSEEELGRFEFHTEWNPKKRLERFL